jgi:hypothetical protein
LTATAPRSKSPSPTKKVTPEIVIEKPEASVNVEDVPSSGDAEEKPDPNDMTGEYIFPFLHAISPSTLHPFSDSHLSCFYER